VNVKFIFQNPNSLLNNNNDTTIRLAGVG